MLPYWALFGIFGIAAVMTDERDQKPSAVVFLLGALLLIVMIGLRRHVGGDWNAYQAIFERLSNLEFGSALRAIDPAYTVLNLLAAKLGLGVWAVNLGCAIIFTYGLVRFCREQPNPALAVLVSIPYLVIVVAMGYTRQGAALGLVLLALVYYFRGSLGRMIVCLTLAVAFHKSAIIVIPFVGLASSRRRVLTLLLLGVVAGLTYWLLVSASLDRLIANYVDAHYSSSGAAIRIAMNLVPAVVLLASRSQFMATREEMRLSVVFSVGSFVALILLLATPSSTAVDRVSLYLIPLQILVLSRVPVVFSDRRAPSLVAKATVIVYSMAVQFIWLNYADNAKAWLPYDNYLFSRA